MNRFRRRLKAFVWIALLAFFGLAVAPTISRAIHLGEPGATAGAFSHHQMAAADGGSAQHHHAHHHPAPTEPSQRTADHQHSLDHCGMCGVAAHGFALWSGPSGAGAFQTGFEPPIAFLIVAPPVRDEWSPATSRGPPHRA